MIRLLDREVCLLCAGLQTISLEEDFCVAATAHELRDAIHGKVVRALTREWQISVADAQMAPNSTNRVLDLELFGYVSFSLRVNVAGEALAQLRPGQDIESWLLEKVSRYLAFNPGIKSGESRTLFLTES